MNNFFKLLIAVFLFAGCSYSQPTTIIVECNIPGIPDSARISFLRNDGQLGKFIEMGYFKNNKVSFTYIPDSLTILPISFSIYGDSIVMGRLSFYAALGITKITGDGTLSMNWSAENTTPEQQELNKLSKAIHKAALPYNKSVERQLQFYSQGIYKGEAIDSLYKQLENNHAVKLNAELNYLKTIKTFNMATLNELNDIVLLGIKFGQSLIPRIEEIRKIYSTLTPAQQNEIKGEEIRETIYPPKQMAIGDIIPDTILYDTLGKPHKLSNYRGKYIILDFWSSGCYPCLLAGDEIKEVQEKFKNKLTIISITTDYEKSWRDATAKHNISWTNLSDYKGRFAGFCSQFTFDAIPYFVIVDPSGKIIGNWFGYSKNNIYDKVKEFCK